MSILRERGPGSPRRPVGTLFCEAHGNFRFRRLHDWNRMWYTAHWISFFSGAAGQILNGGGMAMNTKSRYILPVLTVIVAALSVLSIVTFAVRSRTNISDNNREYLLDTGAFIRERERWPQIGVDMNIEYLKEFQDARMRWLDEYFESLFDY